MAADLKMALLELLRKYQDDPGLDALREGLRWLAQQLIELEVSEVIVAQRYERTETRRTYRNGYRPRRWRLSGKTPACIRVEKPGIRPSIRPTVKRCIGVQAAGLPAG
ncbi:hypothetical protein MPNT_230042 [Candidatus Methylacidithermus pantelleriae]|uniref:Transposase, Mutator family n=1 Tax=Candidatus Methylacidithermus pantelleriae TaxID=2744239 RepID=A0A8J2BP03_9BACT|nr:hypothetical protein MPNT_230042 [Candidatus Methylacidithermus pantelleriae]